MRINRFPKMAALQYKRALRLGFDEPHAKAIGIAEATKYAIFKNLSYKRRVASEKEAVVKKYKKPETLLDTTTYEIFKLQALDGWPFVGDKIYTDEDYDRYFMKWGDEVKSKIEEWAEEIIKKCDEKVLKSENKFFNECWKPHRDELSSVE
ncbi:hypothetical protein [Caminibacter pacificus]|uniref:Uncharacterized protein n=1 Tax=Caminibacter pacificus TaxID=1424653 RepID=A0AAJ4UYI1_9BACT|nr:hypothetical protein [Caminibacter pacificus]QCI28394.1 hypothetical protein C6V80_05315 [Caminibacter pacificus]ROR40882.1 hypothetical protein EDC58_0363 [Caminibacter pacificus]